MDSFNMFEPESYLVMDTLCLIVLKMMGSCTVYSVFETSFLMNDFQICIHAFSTRHLIMIESAVSFLKKKKKH